MGIDHSNPYIHSTTVLCDTQVVYGHIIITVHHSGYYSLVSLIFGTIIPTSFNILMKCFYTCKIHVFSYELI